MNVRIKFLGGAQSVTGSRFLLEMDSFRILVDCGLFQGLKDLRVRNWEEFPVNPATIHCVVVSHAHIDHTGYLPKLVKEGFYGPVYCTHPTADLMEIMLLDSARLQEEESDYAHLKGYSRHEIPRPLYTEENAQAVFPLLKSYGYHERILLGDRVELIFRDAGHLLGSAISEIFIRGDHQKKKIVFSGDLGRYDNKMLNPPETIEHADVLVVESTYGNKDNPDTDPEVDLARIANETFQREGVLLIPAFAVGRTQLLLYHLRRLMDSGKIPDVPVYIDSPMATSSTYLFFKHPKFLKENFNLKAFAKEVETNMLVFTKSNEHSKALNAIRKKAIIISSSGMMTGGRVLHHLYHRLPRKEDTVLIVGFQAEGTRGRRLLEGEKSIKIFGEQVPVNCKIEFINSLSGHADMPELMRWLSGFREKPKITFTVHGEGENLNVYAETIRTRFGWNVTVPQYLESVQLFEGI